MGIVLSSPFLHKKFFKYLCPPPTTGAREAKATQKQALKLLKSVDASGIDRARAAEILAAIQVSPEAQLGGNIGKIIDGDLIEIDAEQGSLEVNAEHDIATRSTPMPDLEASHSGMGRELFSAFRAQVGSAESGASIF